MNCSVVHKNTPAATRTDGTPHWYAFKVFVVATAFILHCLSVQCVVFVSPKMKLNLEMNEKACRDTNACLR